MLIIHQELDETPRGDPQYSERCFKCLRALSKERDIFPECFTMNKGVVRKSGDPIDGGGAADIYRGTLNGKVVCLKVLRIFQVTEAEKKRLLKELCREAVMWKQLKHKNILPFIGVDITSFPNKFCLISPWMNNGNLIKFLESHKTHNRLKCIREIVNAVVYLHNFAPPIVHGDIRGNNVLVADDQRCLLGDFGSSLFIATQIPSRNTLNQNSTRWLSPECQLPPESPAYEIQPSPARDIYALGCTIIEIFTLKPPFSTIRHDGSVSNLVINKGRHPRPDEISSNNLWKLVEDCMNFYVNKRPTARDVDARLRNM
ncbi:kinase-like domain-containing protein [Desarmillaria tabescens]|uniref:Kinase-like domain-containing protein n=1 Tax=Armillaria tabescens TaxID=1929756 RepID=A0AA39JC54_ARMTA|nr:kinase-like domain-containing protein [Desarmillaria tabescens]KAK0440035.1 kinase-like domain-containing protein [Desarmillaria tabescens]